MPTGGHLVPELQQWGAIFWPHLTWVEKVARPLVVYLFLLVAFRISGKRELSQATLFDFLIILLISNVVQNAMIGEDNSIIGAFAGVATLLTLSFLLNRVTSRSRKVRRLLEGVPTLLVHHGKILDKNMMVENVARNDLLTSLREQGIASLREVRYAILELDGKISVIRDDAQFPEPLDTCVPPEVLAQAAEDDETTVPPEMMPTRSA